MEPLTGYNNELKSAFDAWAPTYSEEATRKLENRGYTYQHLAEVVVHASGMNQGGGLTLEVGTGPGNLGENVRNHVGHVRLHGIDVSPKMLSLARETGAYERLDLAAADEFEYHEPYDTVFSAFAFHSIFDQGRFLGKICKNLNPGGVFVLVDLFPTNPISSQTSDSHSRTYEYGAPSKYVDVRTFGSLAESVGLKIQDHGLLGDRREFDHAWFALTQ